MQWVMLQPMHPCSPRLLHNLVTWYNAALLNIMVLDKWHPYMKENLPMMLITHHNNDRLLLIL
jgi:hypothetical protein